MTRRLPTFAANVAVISTLFVLILDLWGEVSLSVSSEWFRVGVLRPQEALCVARSDACSIVEGLRSERVASFSVGQELPVELYQRVIELAYPIRAMANASPVVDFCRNAQPGATIRLRVALRSIRPIKDSDVCVYDRP